MRVLTRIRHFVTVGAHQDPTAHETTFAQALTLFWGEEFQLAAVKG
jgi:hypothetical protein